MTTHNPFIDVIRAALEAGHMGPSFLLIPTASQKSFYGKAIIHLNGDVIALSSYGTLVCVIHRDAQGKGYHGVWLPWGGWSATTAKHVSAFLQTFLPDHCKEGLIPALEGEGSASKVHSFKWVMITVERFVVGPSGQLLKVYYRPE